MIRKINKLVGLKKTIFDEYVDNGKITLSESRLIPYVKTVKDEIALTSILLSSMRLVKEFRYRIFKELKLKRSGKPYFYTEVCFKDISINEETSRLDGLILIVISGVIQDAVFIEVKNGNSLLKQDQILKYYKLAQSLSNVPKILTISNQFVADSSHSPIVIKNQSKKIDLYHFSWIYIKTLAQLLLFDNDDNIEDEDQVEIMREVMCYFDHKHSGVSGFHRMSAGWKKVADMVKAQQVLADETMLLDAVTSWYQEEADMTLMLSRKLGVLVKSNIEDPKKKIARDIKKLKKEHSLSTKLRVKGAVSDIKVTVDFERKTISMSVNVTPPLDQSPIVRIGWLNKQLKKQLKKTDNSLFLDDLYIEADIKWKTSAKSIKYKYTSNLDKFYEHENIKKEDIVEFKLELLKSAPFNSVHKFVEVIENMLLDYYKLIVQDLETWHKPAPKLKTKDDDLD